jgi:succinate-semialdehyde dehydrogenase/glutarate-semialdehyde dehydrogenase
MQDIDPSTGEPGASYEEDTTAAIDGKLRTARDTFDRWRTRRVDDRAALLRVTAEKLRERKDRFADLMAREMGKPIAQGVAEIEKCASGCEHYADHAAALLAREPVKTDARESFVSYQPLGVVLAIMPWNFPFWQVLRHAAPVLAAGNTIVLKHAEIVMGCAIEIGALMDEVFGPGHVTPLMITREGVNDVIRDPRVAAVTITGSTRAGKSVAATAGSVLKKVVLELGGSDPYVILEDADLDRAAELCAKSRLINSGQSCIAAKRFIAVDAIHDAFLERFVAHMSAAKMGDPRSAGTEVGPQAREDLRDEVAKQVSRSVDAGARVCTGGATPKRPGFYYPPTVLSEVTPGMAAFDEEVFGPVAAVTRAKDEDEAIALANRTVYGLGAAVFTRDVARGREIAETRLSAGSCFVNALVKSDPRLPFGGIGESGHGRELGRFGVHELVNVKSVFIG